MAEIARQMKVTSPTDSEYLRWLLEVDLIFEREKGYYFADAVFKYWLVHSTMGIEVDYVPQSEDMWGLIKKLDESFQRASSELGLAIEGKIFQLIQSFNGQEIEQSLFLASPYKDKRIVLPEFENIHRYQSPDNRFAIDLIAEDGEKWAVEIKWKNKATGLKELKKYYQNTKGLVEKLWFISASGFTDAAIEFARTNKILLSDKASIEAITERVEIRIVQ